MKVAEAAVVVELVVGEDEIVVGDTLTVKAKRPLSPRESLVVPLAVYVPAARVPLVVTTPLDETTRLVPVSWVKVGTVPVAERLIW